MQTQGMWLHVVKFSGKANHVTLLTLPLGISKKKKHTDSSINQMICDLYLLQTKYGDIMTAHLL